MKIVDLKCPHCGGRLVPVEGNSKIVSCEYCQSQYLLEDDRVINYHVHQYGPPPEKSNQKQNTYTSDSSSAGLLIVAVAVIFAGVLLVSALTAVNGGKSRSHSAYSPSLSYEGQGEENEEETERSSHSPFYGTMLEAMYGKPADEVTLQEREKLRYFSLRTTNDFFNVDYSFDDPYGEKEINVQSLSLNPEDWNKDDLVEFPNLTKLELDYRWDDGTVFGKLENLKGLCCTGVTPEELKELVLPEQFVELGLEDPDSLEGISAFENLQILTIHDVESPDIRQLIPLKALKTLIIEEDEPSSSLVSSENSNPMTDYSPLSVMTGLERLSLKTSSIREFSFLKPLTALTDLSIEDSEAISLDPLAELTGLSVLYIADNASVQDYSPIGRLFGLKRLTIKKDSSPDDPDLSALSQLEELDIEGFNSLSGLRNLDSLKILSIHGCNANGIEGLSSLVNVECLTCYNLWAYGYAVENLHFIDGMAKLRYLDLCGIHNEEWGIFRRHLEVYGDISNVFNHPGLEELYLNGCTFGIDFDRLGENVSLKKLQMKEVSIKENFYVQSYGSVTDVWYDDVSFDEHTGFLTNYSNLEELYLDGNQLTNIQFVEGLANLTHLGINNNYVTELSPLNQAQRLEYLDIRQNPISGTIETGDGVEIVR